eukprot:916434-Rhodomonas_salina.1
MGAGKSEAALRLECKTFLNGLAEKMEPGPERDRLERAECTTKWLRETKLLLRVGDCLLLCC